MAARRPTRLVINGVTTMDRLSSISAFVRTVEQGSFARAGKTLGVHGSAVSKRVARLEEHLGLRLFHRTTRSLSLTEEGQVFLEHCQRILDDFEDVEHAMSRRAGLPRGRLTVTLPVALGRLHILPALTRLLADHPEVELVTLLDDRHVDLVAEGYDAAVRIGAPQDSSLIGRRLATIRYVVCASENYLAEMGIPESPQDLVRHRCITFVPSAGARSSPWRFAGSDGGESYDLPVSGPLKVNNAEALVEAAEHGAGLVQLHSYLAAPAIASGRLSPVLEEFAADGPPIMVLYPSARQLSPKMRIFVDMVTGLFSPRPPWEAGYS